MKKTMLHAMLCIAIAAGCSTAAEAQDSVIIIRHGEKPSSGDNLSCKGLNRALGIPGSLSGQFSIPLYTYVPTLSTGSNTSHARMFETVTPFAVKYNLTVNTKHDESATTEVANAVIGKLGSKSKHGTILLVWEHSNIPPIAKAMNVKNVPDWASADFDSIWIITGAGTKNAKLVKGAEGLNGVSTTCP